MAKHGLEDRLAALELKFTEWEARPKETDPG